MTTHFYSQSKQRPHQSNRSIFVANIPYKTNEQELRSFFDKACGHVSEVSIIYDNKTHQSRGFGFVEFDTLVAYEIALTLNGSLLNGRKLKISASESKSTLPSTTTSTAAAESVDSTLISERKTRVVHCKKSNYDVYIGRPSIWGNPFVIGRDGDKADRIRKYRAWIMSQPELIDRAKKELRGRTIACWCKPEACHGDILAEIADAD
jgi:RNA recognition motif-containing protein